MNAQDKSIRTIKTGLERMTLMLLFLIFLKITAFAQVGIQTDNPDASSVLDIVALDKGILIPRVSLTASLSNPDPVSAPATGLLVFNVGESQDVGFYYWNGNAWTLLKTMETNHVQGPSSSTDQAVARFDGTTGNLLKDSDVIISDEGNMSGINNLTLGAFHMPTNAAQGKVLMSDETGNGSWQDAHPLDVKENNMMVAPNVHTINFTGAVNVNHDGGNTASVSLPLTLVEEQVIQVSSTSNIDINTDVPTAIPWDVEMFKDIESFSHSTTTNPSRIYVAVDGTYEINYMFNIDNLQNQRRTMRSRIRVNGTSYVERSACYAFTYSSQDDKATLVSSSFLLDLNAGDYLEILVNRQAQTGVVNLVPDENLLFVRIMRSW